MKCVSGFGVGCSSRREFRNTVTARLARLAAVFLACVAGIPRATAADSAPKKHYLTFQMGVVGTATASSEDAHSRGEKRLEVANRFTGRIEVRPEEVADISPDDSLEVQLKRMEAIQRAMLAGDLKALEQAAPATVVSWFPVGDQAEVTGKISETMTSTGSQSTFGETRASSDYRLESYSGQKVFQARVVNAFVKIRAEQQRYDLQFTLMPDMASTFEAITQTIITDHKEEGNNRHRETSQKVPLDMGPGQLILGYSNYNMVAVVKNLPLAGDAGELLGTTRIPVPKPAGWDGAWDIALDVSWQIDITLPPVELVIAAAGYDEWRPEGSIAKPDEPGNSLMARATLVPKETSEKFVPKVKSIRFELLDTSREPGICLNWPLDAKDRDYDLRLAAVSGGTLSKSDQKLEVTDPRRNEQGQAYAEVRIDSYDFGGRASLRAVCLLADGREIEGVMKGEGGDQTMPRLPKMKGAGWVADSWRKKFKVENLADDDDEEKVAGQTYNGDGFTLYEEYRGWVEQGRHIEGDPTRKDFFVYNKIGADAKGGIALFERVSQLRVHAKLRAAEIIDLPVIYTEADANAKGERIMNLNRRDAPHRVDQHAVVLIATSGFRSHGGGTDSVRNNETTNRAFRPGKVQAVHVEARGVSDGIFSQSRSTASYNLSERDAAFAYDRGVAHELLHSVGVDHHGEGETSKTMYFQGAGDPMNPTGKARFVPYMPSSGEDFGKAVFGRPAVWGDFDRGPTITLKWEDTKEDVAQSLNSDFERALTEERNDPLFDYSGSAQAAKYPQYGKSAAFWGEMALYSEVAAGTTKKGILNSEAFRFNRLLVIGREHQADSGNELCLMRYYFANAYPIDAAETGYYLVRPGMNRAGRELCQSPEGTGANARDHDPKSRFGYAAAGRGNCFSLVCPNDAIPGRTL